jgi:hypothetical protein
MKMTGNWKKRMISYISLHWIKKADIGRFKSLCYMRKGIPECPALPRLVVSLTSGFGFQMNVNSWKQI